MRLSVFILVASKTTRKRKIIHGARTGTVGIRRQVYRWQHWSNVWLTGSAKAGPVHPVPTPPRDRLRQRGSRRAKRLRAFQRQRAG